MAKLYLLGVLLILVAIGYQYREEIKTLVSNTLEDAGLAKSAKVKKQTTTEKQPSTKETTERDDESESLSSDTNADLNANKNYYNPPFDPDNPSEPIISKSGTRMITLNELAAHGHSGPLKPIWLAMLGRVYDVDKGAEHYYGPKGGYNFFTGK